MIPNILTLNDESDVYHFEGPVKFTEKEIDPLFANNIQLFAGLMAGSIVLYLMCKGFTNLIKKLYVDKINQRASANIYSLYQNQSIVLKRKEVDEKIPGFLKSINKKCLNYLNNYISFVMQILGLVFLDLCLASILQITNTQTDFHWMVQINIVASYLNLGFIFYIFYISYKVTSSHTELLKNEKFSCYYGTLIDDINVESNVAKTYSFINLIRKSLFIFFTVYFYYNPLIQTSTCCLAAFVNIALLAFENPFENYKVLIKNGFPDFCIFIILLMTVVLAIDDQNAMFSPETRFFLGWIILTFIGLSISTQLVFLMNQFVRELYSRYLWIKSYFIKQKQEQKKV